MATDYSSVAYWYQAEPHGAFPALLPLSERLPTPTGDNAKQFALATSPLWVPVALGGLNHLRRRRRRRRR